jgi:hypothetical protein
MEVKISAFPINFKDYLHISSFQESAQLRPEVLLRVSVGNLLKVLNNTILKNSAECFLMQLSKVLQ